MLKVNFKLLSCVCLVYKLRQIGCLQRAGLYAGWQLIAQRPLSGDVAAKKRKD